MSSSYYGSTPGTPRSVTPQSAAGTYSTPISSPSDSPRSLRSMSPSEAYDLSKEKYPIEPPAPLKTAHTRRTSTPSLRVQPPQAQGPLPNTFTSPTRSESPSVSRNSPSPHAVRTPSPLSSRAGPSPYSERSQLVSPLSRHTPSPILSPAEYQRSPALRALSPLPENFEIAIPPGAQLRSDIDNSGVIEGFQAPHVHTQASSHYSVRSPSPSHYAPSQRAYTPTLNQSVTPWPAASPVPTLERAPLDRVMTPAELKGMTAPESSTPYELNGLWNAAHGATCDGSHYVLSMFRQPPPTTNLNCPEHFTFGPTMSQPFYTLRALPLSALPDTFNELSLTRCNPLLPSQPSISILNMALNPTCTPDQNGLITHIYPKRAVYALSPHPDKTAIAIAAETECCKLLFNQKLERYELHHPAMNAVGNEASLVIKIEGGKVGFGTLGARGVIKIVNVVNQETLAALDYGKALLWVNTAATRKVPTRHAVDVVVAAVLAVGVVEGRREIVQVPKSPGATAQGRNPARSKREQSSMARGDGRAAAAEKLGREETRPVRKGGIGSVFRGAYFVVWFTLKLPWEILKAIIDAFRSEPPPSPSYRTKGRKGSNGGGKQRKR